MREDVVRVVQSTSVPDRVWTGTVEACHGNALHLPGTHRVGSRNQDLRFLVFTEAEKEIACALAIVKQRRVLRTIPVGGRTWVLPTAPAVVHADKARSVLEALIRHAQAAGVARLVVEPRWGDYLDRHEAFVRYGNEVLTEYVLDLRRPLQEIEQSMHRVHRKNVRRARAREIVVEEDTSMEGLLRLRRLQEISASRASDRNRGFSVIDVRYFYDAYEEIYRPGIGRVFFAKRGENHLAGLAVIHTAKRALTVRSGSTAEGYENYAMYLLHADLIERLHAAGAELLNLGGVPAEAAEPTHPQRGLYDFKRGFGGRECVRIRVDLPLRECRAATEP